MSRFSYPANRAFLSVCFLQLDCVSDVLSCWSWNTHQPMTAYISCREALTVFPSHKFVYRPKNHKEHQRTVMIWYDMTWHDMEWNDYDHCKPNKLCFQTNELSWWLSLKDSRDPDGATCPCDLLGKGQGVPSLSVQWRENPADPGSIHSDLKGTDKAFVRRQPTQFRNYHGIGIRHLRETRGKKFDLGTVPLLSNEAANFALHAQKHRRPDLV